MFAVVALSMAEIQSFTSRNIPVDSIYLASRSFSNYASTTRRREEIGTLVLDTGIFMGRGLF